MKNIAQIDINRTDTKRRLQNSLRCILPTEQDLWQTFLSTQIACFTGGQLRGHLIYFASSPTAFSRQHGRLHILASITPGPSAAPVSYCKPFTPLSTAWLPALPLCQHMGAPEYRQVSPSCACGSPLAAVAGLLPCAPTLHYSASAEPPCCLIIRHSGGRPMPVNWPKTAAISEQTPPRLGFTHKPANTLWCW